MTITELRNLLNTHIAEGRGDMPVYIADRESEYLLDALWHISVEQDTFNLRGGVTVFRLSSF